MRTVRESRSAAILSLAATGFMLAPVAARIRYSTDSTPAEARLVWGLFNGAVLEASVTIAGQDGKSSRHRLSTYEPEITLSRP